MSTHAHVVEVLGADTSAVPPRQQPCDPFDGYDEGTRPRPSLVAVTVRLSRPLTEDEAHGLPRAWGRAPVTAVFGHDPTALTQALTRRGVDVDSHRRDLVVVWVPTTLPARAVEAVERVHRQVLDVVLRGL